MFKKFNMFALTLLILGQTILGPIGVVSAEEYVEPAAQSAGEVEGGETTTTAELEPTPEVVEPEIPTEQPKVEEIQKTEASDSVGDDANGSDEENTSKGEASSSDGEDKKPESDDSSEQAKKALQAATEAVEAAEKAGKNLTEEIYNKAVELVEALDDGEEKEALKTRIGALEISVTAATYIDMPESEIGSAEFKHNGNPATSPVEVKNGDEAAFKFTLKNIDAGHGYGPDSTLTFQLPDVFSGLKVLSGIGSIGEVKTSGTTVTVTFNENILDEFNDGVAIEDVWFEIGATFNKTSEGLKEQVTIPGGLTLELNFTPAGGTPIEKKTNNAYQTNADSIEWEVTVNTNLGATGTVDFVDTLEAGHKFKQENVTVTELTMNANGTYTEGTPGTMSPTLSDLNTKMTLSLAGDKAYKITYKTYPEDPGNGGELSYKNSATYDNSNPKNATAKVDYDTGIKKSRSDSSPNEKLETDWEITVNENKRNLGTITVTDTWSTNGGSTGAKQELVDGVKVYQADGTTEVTSGFSFNQTPGEQGFKITFNNIGTDTYIIKYKTKPTDDTYINSDMTVSNTVTRSDEVDVFEDGESVTYNKKSFMLNKTTPDIDYAAKTIDWSIVANQSKEKLENPVFEDRYENPNMTLDENKLVVKVGGTSFTKATDPNNLSTREYGLVLYEDNDGKQTGFDIKFSGEVEEKVTITYTTDYEITNIGTNHNVYKNTVTLKDDSNVPDTTDWAERKSEDKPEQADNGKKTGHYNYKEKRFEWEVELNFNNNPLQNAIFEDEISNTPAQTIENIKIYKGELDAAGSLINLTEVTGISNSATDANKIKLVLGNIDQPYKITYESRVTKDAIPETAGKLQVKNTATLKDGDTPNAQWSKTVGVNYTDKLINKTGQQIAPNTAGIKWNFEFNYAQSQLGNIVIKDDVGKDDKGNPNQLFVEESFNVYEVTLSGTSNSDSYGAATKASTPLDRSAYDLNVDIKGGTFTLKLPDGDKAYYVEYETIYLGENGKEVKNQVTATYDSADGDSASDFHLFASFSYNGGGNVVKVPFIVVKTDGATGELMPGIQFTLYHAATDRALISDVTDENGVFDIGLSLAEVDYYLIEDNVPTGYKNPGKIPFKLHRDSDKSVGKYKDHQLVEVKNFEEDYVESCTIFTLTIKDVDGNPVSNKSVTLTNDVTGVTHTGNTNGSGEITLPENFSAGKYTVTTEESGETVTLGDVQVKYDGNCEDEIAPTPSCNVFTITVEDDKGIGRPNLAVVLEHKDDNAITIPATTDGNGKFTVPSATTKTGVYKVYEGKQYLGDVTITYKKDPCEAEVQLAPTCEIFTLTVNDIDGKPREAGVNIKLVDTKDDTKVYNGTTIAGGKVDLSTLPAGEYEVFEGNATEAFATFTTNADCEESVQPDRTKTCPTFTITIKDQTNNVGPNTEITLKKAGQADVKSTTDENGKIEVPSENLPAGEYNVYEGGIFLGTVTVSYADDCEATLDTSVSNVGMCKTFTLTVTDRGNNPREGVKVIIKDADDKTVENSYGSKELTTDVNGQVEYGDYVVKPGTYTAYEVDADGNESRINSFTVTTDCEATVKPPTGGGGGWTPPTPNTCDAFTVTVKQNGTTVGANVDLTFKSGTTEVKGSTNADGKIVVNKDNLPEGTYTAFDKDGKEVGSINVSYDEGQCQDEIDLLVKACDVFTVTVKQLDKTVGAGTSVTLKDADGKTVATGTTDKDGKITFNKDDLKSGSYIAYDKDGEKIGDVKVAYDGNCEAELNLPGQTCDVFTITVKESGETVKAGTILSLKDATGKTVATGTTNADGKIIFNKDDLPKGTYTAVDKDSKEIANITVSYDEGKCQAVVDVLLKACEQFKLTVVDTPNKIVEIKDKDGNTVATGTTDANGHVTFTQSIPEGNYEVYIDGEKVGSLPVTDSCEGTVKPGDSGTPGGDRPGEGGDSNTPGGGKPGAGGDANTPGGNKPGKGDANAPGTGKLPQTGEEHYMYMIALGTILLAAGAFVLYRPRRKA